MCWRENDIMMRARANVSPPKRPITHPRSVFSYLKMALFCLSSLSKPKTIRNHDTNRRAMHNRVINGGVRARISLLPSLHACQTSNLAAVLSLVSSEKTLTSPYLLLPGSWGGKPPSKKSAGGKEGNVFFHSSKCSLVPD